jgi:RNA polymerase sigma factor (sigma-70 family)
MTSVQAEKLVRHDAKIRNGELADEDLVDQFLRGEEAGSDAAFKALVERHGPMVLGICRLVLDQEADAEDAFQATFLILAQRGASIRNRAILAAWLHEVAYRTAVKARISVVRRRFLERQCVSMLPSPFVPDRQHHDAAWNELRPVLHDEVRRLPEKYRIPVILSYLEGKTNEEVAELLDWPVGTVKGRLSRARALLRSRLTRRGMALSAAFLVTALADGAVFAEVVPPELIKRTLLFVQKFNVRSPVPDPTSSASSQPLIESSIRSMVEALAVKILQHPKIVLVALSILFISALIAMATASNANGNPSFLRSAFSSLVPGQSSGGSCH